MAQGIIQFLLSDCQEANDLLERFIIKIVPMINPDGVVLGNSRTSMIGADINRTYLNPSKNIHAESYLVKKLVKKL